MELTNLTDFNPELFTDPFNFSQNLSSYNLLDTPTIEEKTIRGTDKNDLFKADEIDRAFYGLDRNDLIIGNAGQDLFFGNNGSDLILGGSNNDTLNGGAGRDYLTGDDGNDLLVGGSDGDILLGQKGNDRIEGESGDDLLWGDDGNDKLDGGVGNDYLKGDRGNDILTDNDGGDSLMGGQGADEFGIGNSLSNSPSIIKDFQVGSDRLKILRLGATFEDLKIEDSQDGVVIRDSDREIAILEGVQASDLDRDSFIFGNAELGNELQQTIQQSLQGTQVPDISVAIVAPDGTTWLNSNGVSNVESNTPLNANDRFNVGSITKPLVATTVLQLVEEGRLSLDDTLAQRLPDIADKIANSDRITIRQMLNMTSGIAEYFPSGVETEALPSLENSSILEQKYTPQQLISRIEGKPASFEPGQKVEYTNSNYLLLGQIVEAVTGSTLAQQMRERIFEPLGMTNTFYPPQESVPGGLTRGYTDFGADGKLENTRAEKGNFSLADAAGAVVSTPSDIARFAQGLFKGQLLAPDTLKEMVEGRDGNIEGGGIQGSYGLGIGIADVPNLGKVWAHPGTYWGWASLMAYIPDRDITVVVMENAATNGSDGSVNSPSTDPTSLGVAIAQNVAQQYSVLRGSTSNDSLEGSDGNDTLYGMAGNDFVNGDNGDDSLQGGTGNDRLIGGDGNDILVDSDGGDTLTGGRGIDQFWLGGWSSNNTPSAIADFEVGIDKLKVNRMGATFDRLTIQNSNEGVIISDRDNVLAILSSIDAAELTAENFIFGDLNLAEQLQATLDQNLDKAGATGATNAIITPDGFVWEGATGISEKENQTPMQSDDLFDIGSINKTFIAATALKVAESGKLSLDDTLGQWLPEIAQKIPNGESITLRQLLNGTSGIYSIDVDEQFLSDVFSDRAQGSTRQWRSEDLVAYAYGKPRFSGFGSYSKWTYPTTGNILAKLIVEKATEESFESVMRSEILEPLGLKHTFLRGEKNISGNLARGYQDSIQADGSFGSDGIIDDFTDVNPSLSEAATLLVSDAQDLARFSQALFGGELLQPDSLQQMLTFVDEGILFEGNGYGLGVASYEDELGSYFGKSGDNPGYSSEMRYFRDRGGAVVVALVNGRMPEQGKDGAAPILNASIETLFDRSV
jgi:CubicO group peptidase (beta-lactamase class C family)